VGESPANSDIKIFVSTSTVTADQAITETDGVVLDTGGAGKKVKKVLHC